MLLNRRWAVFGTAVALATPALAQPGFDLGAYWQVEEVSRTVYWTGIWTRRGTSRTFDANWTEKRSRQTVADVLEFRGLRGGEVVLHRRHLNGEYFGRVAPDGRSIRGSASWYDADAYWTAVIES